MAIKHTLSGDKGWNENYITIEHRTPTELLISVGDEYEDKTILVSIGDFIDFARAVGIVAGQKLPSKPLKP